MESQSGESENSAFPSGNLESWWGLLMVHLNLHRHAAVLAMDQIQNVQNVQLRQNEDDQEPEGEQLIMCP